MHLSYISFYKLWIYTSIKKCQREILAKNFTSLNNVDKQKRNRLLLILVNSILVVYHLAAVGTEKLTTGQEECGHITQLLYDLSWSWYLVEPIHFLTCTQFYHIFSLTIKRSFFFALSKIITHKAQETFLKKTIPKTISPYDVLALFWEPIVSRLLKATLFIAMFFKRMLLFLLKPTDLYWKFNIFDIFTPPFTTYKRSTSKSRWC